MRDRRFCQHEARIVGEQRDRAQHNDECEAGIGHEAQLMSLDADIDHLRDRAGNRHRRRQDDVVGEEIDDQEDDCREEVGGEAGEYVLHRRFRFSCLRAGWLAAHRI